MFPLPKTTKIKTPISVRVDEEILERLRDCQPEGVSLTDIVEAGLLGACDYYEKLKKRKSKR